jgi:uncharacterized protein (DUF849 family)
VESNLALVEEAVRMIRAHGAEPASVADMRRALQSSTVKIGDTGR